MTPEERISAYRAGAVVQFNTAVLAEPQRALWARLVDMPLDFVLYGGTALALRLGHRRSDDFDFFSPHSFTSGDLLRRLRSVTAGSTVQAVQTEPNSLVAFIDDVKLSFFGGLDIRAMQRPDIAADTGIPVASLRDLAAAKAKALALDRIEPKDYLDVAALLDAGLTLGEIAASFVAVFDAEAQPMLFVKAVGDLDHPALGVLPLETRSRLAEAVRQTGAIPPLVARFASILADLLD